MIEGRLLWKPSKKMIENSNISKFMRWLKEKKGLHFKRYEDLWTWSVQEIEAFWLAVWEYFKIEGSKGETVLEGIEMPFVKWFPDATINYAEHVFRNETSEKPAIIFKSENHSQKEISWKALKEQTAAIAHYLKSIGIQPGDRIVSYVSNIPETIAVFLACASIGAIWSSCAPEFGTKSVIERFKQIEPKVLVATDGYQYGGKKFDCIPKIKELQQALPTLKKQL